MKRIALFAFNGDPICFVHVLLNALDMSSGGAEVRIVLEGSATGLVPAMAREGGPLSGLYRRAKEQGLIEGACRACSAKMKVLAEVEGEGIPLLEGMSGHPGMWAYLEGV